MVATLILRQDENGNLPDLEGHLHNEAGQRIDAQGTVIPEPETKATGAAKPVKEANRPRTMADYNRPDQLYANWFVSIHSGSINTSSEELGIEKHQGGVDGVD
ncbi:hypothetical protein Bca4012_065176 [Brassica carinata]